MSTERDKDARAAMTRIMFSPFAGAVGVRTVDDVAREAWLYADAMEAERAKRETKALHDDMDRADVVLTKESELAAARREGRDAGLREAVAMLRALGMTPALYEVENLLDKAPAPAPAPAPDVAALRAVAEAALRVRRWSHQLEGGADDDGREDALDAALQSWFPGWRTTKETP